MAWTRERIEIPDDIVGENRELLAQEVLQFIRDRTDTGKDKNNVKFPKYSRSYINSLDFRNAGKKAGNVNIKLSGDTMAAMDVISHKKGSILIGYENGTRENNVAEGNITGSYGRNPNPGKARDFLGISKGDLSNIIKREKILDLPKEVVQEILLFTPELIKAVLSGIKKTIGVGVTLEEIRILENKNRKLGL